MEEKVRRGEEDWRNVKREGKGGGERREGKRRREEVGE